MWLELNIGIAGFVTMVGLGAYNYKNRGTMSTSMYLMQLRVASQGTVVGTLCLGLMYSIYTRYMNLRKREALEAQQSSSKQ